jgi:hypothetical protein
LAIVKILLFNRWLVTEPQSLVDQLMTSLCLREHVAPRSGPIGRTRNVNSVLEPHTHGVNRRRVFEHGGILKPSVTSQNIRAERPEYKFSTLLVMILCPTS